MDGKEFDLSMQVSCQNCPYKLIDIQSSRKLTAG